MEYRGFIFTKHALERLSDRSISKDAVVSVLESPDQTKPTGKRDTTKFIRTINGRLIHVVATFLPNQNKWLVVSVWVRGENDKVPLMWRILTAPFRLVWWLLKQIYHSEA